MHFPPPAADGGGRVSSKRSPNQGDSNIGDTSGIQGRQEVGNSRQGQGSSIPYRKDNGTVAGVDVGNASTAGDLNNLFAATAGGGAAAIGSFCPAIIAPTQAPSALAAAAAYDDNNTGGCDDDCSTANDSFLGFGLDVPPQELWEEPAAGGGGRGRAPSSDGVDLGGGCDLGWGLMDGDDDNMRTRGRGRGDGDEEEEQEEEEEQGHDCSCDDYAEGRALSVPDIPPHWSYEGSMEGQTRSARARSSSFYEGDDADVLACINGETPAPKTSRRSSSFADLGDLSRNGSLAYSSSGDFSTSGELDKLLRSRDSSPGLTSSQAAAVVGAGGGKDGGVPCGAQTTVAGAAPGRRQLGQRELQALQAGLHTPVPGGGRKYSSGDDRSFSSDSDQNSDDDDEEEGYFSREEERPVVSREREEEPFYPGQEGRSSTTEYGYRDGGGLAGGSPPMELPGMFAYGRRAGVDGEVLPPQRNNDGGEDGGGMIASGSASSLQALVGGHVLPPGVDPFLSVTGSEGSGGLSLSPRAVIMSSGAATDTATAAAAAAFPLAVPMPLPPHQSPPRPRAAAPIGDSNSAELGPPGMDIPEPRHAPLVLWPPAEDGTPAATVVAVAEARALTCEAPDGSSPSSLCSPPVMLASLSLGAAPGSPRPRTPIDDQSVGLQSLVASPPAPPPSQLAPLPPPPEPLAPSPPRPRTPASPSSQAPSPAGGSRSRGGTDSSRSDAASLPYEASDESRGGGGGRSGGNESGRASGSSSGHGSAAGSGSGGDGSRGQVNLLMPPPPPPPPGSRGCGSASYGSGSGGGGGAGRRMGPAGPGTGVFGSGGSSGGGGGVSRLTGPGGPFGSNRPNRPGEGGGGYPGARARYRSGGGGGKGGSILFGSDPGTLGHSSAHREHGLRGSSSVQGFLSVGGGNRSRRGHGGAQQSKKIKLLMLGDSGVGKSSLMDRFTEDYFNLTKIQTLGVDFKLKTIVINEEEVDLQVWDTAGQQKFHKITQAYYRGSHGIVLVYDVSDPQTLDNTAYWMKSIRDTAGSNRVQICLVGNKVDLREGDGQERQQGGGMVETNAGRKVAKEFGAEYFECSAKTGLMVEEAFVATAIKAYEAHLVKPATPSSRSRRRLGRKKPHQSASMGSSDKDRPPRSDASWSTSSSLSGVGVESSAERLDNAQMRQGASGMSETSTANVAGQTAAVYSHFSGTVPGGHQRHMSFGSSYTVLTPTTSSSCGSPSTPFGQPAMATTPPGGTQSPQQQQQQQQPSPPFTVRRGEQQQQQQQIRDLLPPLSALSPKTAAAALGMGTRKGAAVGAAGEDSPTGTGTMSPPAHQRSIGRSSSLGDMESYFGTALASPKSSDNDSSAADGGWGGGRRGGAARRRADTGGLFGLFGGGGEFPSEFGGGGGGGGDGGGGGGDDSRSGPQAVAEIIARQRQRSSPRPTAGPGPWGDDPPPPAISRMKGKKPPRVPRMKRMASGDSADGSGARGRGGKNSCKIS